MITDAQVEAAADAIFASIKKPRFERARAALEAAAQAAPAPIAAPGEYDELCKKLAHGCVWSDFDGVHVNESETDALMRDAAAAIRKLTVEVKDARNATTTGLKLRRNEAAALKEKS